jgi:hypothetical protein
MAVEITYKGKPSGITITDAEWWCHLFTIDGDIKFVLMMRVKELKERIKQLARTNFVKIVKGGDNDDSEIILVPIQKVVGYTWK